MLAGTQRLSTLSRNRTALTHVNSWFPAAYMSYTSQNLRLFLVSNLSVLNLRIFRLMYSESLTQTERHRDPVASRPRLLCYSATLWPLLHCYSCGQSYSGCCFYATLLLCGQSYSVATATLLHCYSAANPILWLLFLCYICYSAANPTLWPLLLCYIATLRPMLLCGLCYPVPLLLCDRCYSATLLLGDMGTL